jgi:uncharacterized membrane protein
LGRRSFITGGRALNPFDIKSILLAKHAQHVVLIHFPIALFIVGVGFDIMAQWKRNSTLLAANYYNLLVAAVSTVPVMVTGIIAWRWQLEGARLHGNLLLHLVLGISSSLLIWMVWWIHYQARRKPDRVLPVYRFPIELIGVLVVGLTGHLGGFLSGVNG